VGIGATHCGPGCTPGDIIATWVVLALGLSVAGLALPYEYLFAYTFVFALVPGRAEASQRGSRITTGILRSVLAW
jgi:hypothetical protein